MAEPMEIDDLIDEINEAMESGDEPTGWADLTEEEEQALLDCLPDEGEEVTADLEAVLLGSGDTASPSLTDSETASPSETDDTNKLVLRGVPAGQPLFDGAGWRTTDLAKVTLTLGVILRCGPFVPVKTVCRIGRGESPILVTLFENHASLVREVLQYSHRLRSAGPMFRTIYVSQYRGRRNGQGPQ